MSFSHQNFNLYRSYLLKTHPEDNIEIQITLSDFERPIMVKGPFKVYAINMNYLSFDGPSGMPDNTQIEVRLKIKGFLSHWEIDLNGEIIRQFHHDEIVNYGVKIKPTTELKYFLKEFVNSFSSVRLRDSLVLSSLSEKSYSLHDGIEIFSTLSDFYCDLLRNKETLNLKESLEEFRKIVNAEELNVYLINTSTQKLENIVTTRAEKYKHCHYQESFLGQVFSNAEPLNYMGTIDKKPVSYLFYPIIRSQKTIGVVELKNKIDHERFEYREERALRLMSFMLSNYYHKFEPFSGNTPIDAFNPYLSHKPLIFGVSKDSIEMDRMMKKACLYDTPILLQGEKGMGKIELAKRMIKRSPQAHQTIETLNFSNQLNQEINHIDWFESGSIIIANLEMLDRRAQKILFEKIRYGKKRVFTISHIDFQELSSQNKIYQPLASHLSQLTFTLTPLRQRKDELISLATLILKRECERRNDPIERTFSPETLLKIQEHLWPANFEELEKTIRKALLIQPDQTVLELDLQTGTELVIQDKIDQVYQEILLYADQIFSHKTHLNLLDELTRSLNVPPVGKSVKAS
jgi:transcriptional regulator with PAS, ATPase and Fis domain